MWGGFGAGGKGRCRCLCPERGFVPPQSTIATARARACIALKKKSGKGAGQMHGVSLISLGHLRAQRQPGFVLCPVAGGLQGLGDQQVSWRVSLFQAVLPEIRARCRVWWR